jgi:hypothetical protein
LIVSGRGISLNATLPAGNFIPDKSPRGKFVR